MFTEPVTCSARHHDRARAAIAALLALSVAVLLLGGCANQDSGPAFDTQQRTACRTADGIREVQS